MCLRPEIEPNIRASAPRPSEATLRSWVVSLMTVFPTSMAAGRPLDVSQACSALSSNSGSREPSPAATGSCSKAARNAVRSSLNGVRTVSPCQIVARSRRVPAGMSFLTIEAIAARVRDSASAGVP